MKDSVSRQARRADEEKASEDNAFSIRERAAGYGRNAGADETRIEEEPVPYEKLPAAVRKAVEENLPGASGHDAVRLQTGELVLFHVLAHRGKTGLAITVSPTGDIVEIERDVPPARLPKSVKQALTAYYPGIVFSAAGMVTLHFYEFEYEDENRNVRVAQIDASGRLLQDVEAAEA